MSPVCRLGPSDALVMTLCPPRPSRYFSSATYVWRRQPRRRQVQWGREEEEEEEETSPSTSPGAGAPHHLSRCLRDTRKRTDQHDDDAKRHAVSSRFRSTAGVGHYRRRRYVRDDSKRRRVGEGVVAVTRGDSEGESRTFSDIRSRRRSDTLLARRALAG